jgi:small subunit ribosomal protein S20
LLLAPVGRRPPLRSPGIPFAGIPFETSEDLHVANIASQIKRNRQNEKRRLRNKSVRAELRTRSKSAVTAAQAGAEDSIEQLRLAVKRIDKAAARGVIHKNTAANHKSRLVRRVAAIEAAAAAAYEPADDEVGEEVDE